MMRKNYLLTMMMVLLGLLAGVGTMRGQSLGDIDLQNPATWFYVNLEAKVSTPACGSNPGQVKLNYTNTRREQDNPWITGTKPVNPYNEETEWSYYDSWRDGWNVGVDDATAGKARNEYPDYYYVDYDPTKGFIEGDKRPEGHDAAWDWYTAGHYLNTITGESADEYQTAWGASANLNGYALFHMEGVDSVNGMFSSYAYFEAKVQENDGWYFTGWSFTEGESDLGGAVDTDTEEDKGKLFKIFPADDPGWANKSQEYVYATFKPVMVANYAVNGTIDLIPGNGNSGNNTVIFDVQGDRVSADDFTASVASAATDGYTGHGSCSASAALVNGQIVVTVTYTASDAESGIYRANVTLRSKSGCSELTAPMYVRVSPAAGSEAALYNGKAEPANYVTSGTLAAMIDAATAEQTVALNANYADVVTINKDVTFDLNGYTLSNNLVVSGANVTLAYSKYKGKITKTVAVQSGATLTLNGGTIEVSGAGNPLNPSGAVVAVNVADGGKLIQNGATISATALTCYAIGINVDGEAEVKDGSITAHAGMTAAFAAQVSATGKLTTTGGAFNASVDQTHNPDADPADQSTWSNAYAVYVSETSGEATIKGGSFNSTSSYDGAFAVCALATFGKLTIEKGAVVSAHTVSSDPVAYAVGTMGDADLTVNGGRFSATYVEDEEIKPCPPFLCAEFDKLTFNAGTIKADSVFVREEGMFPATMTLVQPKLYNIVYKGKDYMDGYRYLAVREGLDAKEYGMQAARIGTTGYTSIVDALSYANNNRDKDVVIILQNDDVLPAGYYTLPSKATLIIPMKNEQETGNSIIPRVASTSGAPLEYIQPYAYVTLTVADGANVDVHGTIEVSGTQRATDGSYAAHPHGPCGFVNMQEGSRMTMQSGSELRAWGFIIGKGETDVRRNATVREQFQMGDWKGGSTSFGMLSDHRRVFPLTHYFIQNIESPFKYHPGAILSTTTAVSATFGGIALTASANDIKVIGVNHRDEAMFLMDNEADAENTWVRKWYDVEHDLQVYDVNNSAHIGSMVLDLGKLGNTPLQMNSGYFVLPITCNFKIHLLSGMMDFTQNTALLPGAEVEIDKEATVTIAKNSDNSVLSGSLYIYDADQWDKYAYDEGGIKYTKPVQYAAGFGGKPTARAEQFTDRTKLKDATINVHGSFAITEEDCYLYTSDGGANIFSTNEDAGTFVFYEMGPITSNVAQVWQVKNRGDYTNTGDMEGHNDGDGDYFTAAKLVNGDGTFTETTNYGYNSSLCYMNDAWRYRMFFDCYAADVDMDVYFEEVMKKVAIAAPHIAEYLFARTVAASQQPSTDLTPEMFAILKNNGLLNDQLSQLALLFASYEAEGYDLGKSVQHIYIKPQEWMEITGKAEIEFDWDDTQVAEWDAAYEGGDNSVIEDFETALNEWAYNPYLLGVTGNADHTYSDAAGTGRLFIQVGEDCQWWEVENVDNLYHCIHPNNDTYYYWDESNEVWEEKRFTITWKNWDGEPLITYDYSDPESEPQPTTYDVTYGTMAEYLGTNPTREANIDSTYNFTGWKPALGPVTQDVTYTATYESQPRMYTIIFCQEGGVEIERQFLTHNDVPACENTPTRPGHTLVWSPAISPVIGDQTYTATWLENPPTKWDVTFVNNANGVLQATAAVGIAEHPVYSGSTPVKENADHSDYSSNEYTYTFWGWNAVIDGVAQQFASGDELPCPTAPTTYTAVYTEGYQTYAVTFRKEDPENPGQYITIETNNYRYGETPVCSATPIKENTAEWTYGFAWTPNIQTVQGAATYTATFPPTKNKYTVTLTSNLSGVCTFTGAGTFDYGTTIDNVAVSYNSEKYTFDGWSDSETDAAHPSFTLTGDVTLTANFTPKPEALNDHTVATGEAWAVPEDTEVKDLILTSDGSACGQLLNPENLTIRGEAIFRQNQSFDAGQWYAVAVPWRVNPATGIYGASSRLASGSQIYIIEFDGAAYADAGGSEDHPYWHFLHQTGADMVPGKLYMIYLASAQSKLDFHKKAGAALQTRNLTVSTASGSAGASFANWNAISNPALYTADLSTGVTAYQTYDNNDGYTVVPATTSSLIVAKPIFVQVAISSTVYATIPEPASPAPYRRSQQAENEAKFVVEISRNGKMADRLIVKTADEKENRYVIGQDLAKFGVSSKVAQMWINRYDAKLCVNTLAWDGERAEYPLSIFAPATAEYTIHLTPYTNEDYSLYLTRNGEAIWNLSEGDYVLNLERGTATNYGLRVSARAPQVTTGIDEAIIDAKDETATKVLINNQVLIIRGEKVYTIDGQLVK